MSASHEDSNVPVARPVRQGDHVFLIDGSGYIFRAYHALPPLTRPSDGLPTGAVHGFCQMLWKLLKDTSDEYEPTHLAVIFDYSGRSFRNDIYPEYKANRPPAPEDLVPQFSIIRDATRAFNVACIEQEGYEADDLIATYAKQAVEAGAEVNIISSDKDLMQLVRPGVLMVDTMKNRHIGPEQVVERFGLGPDKVVEIQALAGDSTDNVPGVPGIGVKTAAPIVREIGTLDNLLGPDADVDGVIKKLQNELDGVQKKLDTIAGEPLKLSSAAQIGAVLNEKLGVKASALKKDKKGNPTADTKLIEELSLSEDEKAADFCKDVFRARELNKLISSQIEQILTHAEQARISRELVLLKDDVPVEVSLDTTGVREPVADEILGFMVEMEFTTMTRRIAEALDAEPPAQKPPSPRGGESLPPREAGSRGEGGPSSKSGTQSPSPGRSSRGRGESEASPSTLAARRANDIARLPIDRSRYETVTDVAALQRWMDAAKKKGYVAFDTETDSLDAMQARLVGVSMATEPGVACYVPLQHGAGDGLDLDGADDATQIPLKQALEIMKPMLEDESILKIGQNLKYDMLVLAQHGIELTPMDDTMLMSYALDAGRGRHGMDELALRHLGHVCIAFKDIAGTGKSALTFDRIPIDKASEYAAEDADVTLRLWLVLKPRLAAEGRTTVYETLERPLGPVLARMERHGVHVERQVLSRLSGAFAQKQGGLEDSIQKTAGTEFNIASPRQLGEILFDKMGLPGGKKTKSGQWETRAGLLDDLAANEELDEKARGFIQEMLEWRQLAKLRSTYTDTLPLHINPETGRIHTSYAMAATSTGRLASTDPNLQNIPVRTPEGRSIRTAFTAEKGNKLISADYSQIELRVLAHIADIPALKKAFEDGLDIHAMTASEMFGVAVKDMPPETRRRAKAINFGIIYGISAFGLAAQLGIPRGEAADYIKTYFERFPGIRDYMEATKETARKQGYVETLFGRRMHFTDINSKNQQVRGFKERAAINAPIQGSAADIIRRAMVRMEAALKAGGVTAKMLLQVHDELIFEAPEAEVEKTILVAKDVMETSPTPAVQLSVPLQVDARAADNWDEAH